MEKYQNILPKGTIIAGKYEIQFSLGRNSFSQAYRAKTKNGDIIRLELINIASLPSTFFNENGSLTHLSLLKNIKHINISELKEEGETIIENQKTTFLTFNFISGETLAEKLKREVKLSPYEAVPIIAELLDAIDYLQKLPDPVIHNGISPTSVLLDLSNKREKPVLTGFEQLRTIHNNNQSVTIKDLSLFHSAPELLNGVFVTQSDLFSVGALLYHLLFGIAPWFNENILTQPVKKAKKLIELERQKELNFEFVNENEIDDHLKYTIVKALSIDLERRFQTAEEFAKALKREIMVEYHDVNKTFDNQFELKIKKEGSGFDQIAGMSELKELLYNDVIRAITDKERFEKYGIPMLNGLLLYGPPGCGKTFIAQKFAEEVGYHFVMIKPSDLQSKWVNATQENISKLFKEAEKNAPTIIFIDELDAIVPSRENDIHQMHASAVNEVLAQMSSCGERGIFVVAATNRPEKIDSAILRSGRIDKIIYLPPPDYDARKALFKIYLESRYADLGLDYDNLAILTENYVSSDIKLVIDDASRKAERKDTRITMQILKEVIKENMPSVTLKEIKKYETLKQHWENEKQNVENVINKNPFGFDIPTKKE